MLVALQFQEISVAEQLFEPASDPVSFIKVPVIDQPGHLGRRAAGDSDEAAVVLFQQLAVDAGTVVETINVGPSDQFHQVAIARIVPCQQEQVVGAALVGRFVEAAAFGDVNLAPDNWLDGRLFAGLVEFHDAVHGAMVSNCYGVHSQRFRLGHQVGNLADAVQHAVLSVDVQVGESVVNDRICHSDL